MEVSIVYKYFFPKFNLKSFCKKIYKTVKTHINRQIWTIIPHISKPRHHFFQPNQYAETLAKYDLSLSGGHTVLKLYIPWISCFPLLGLLKIKTIKT